MTHKLYKTHNYVYNAAKITIVKDRHPYCSFSAELLFGQALYPSYFQLKMYYPF